MKIQLFSDLHGLRDEHLDKKERMLFHEGAREADLIVVPGDCGGTLESAIDNLSSLSLNKPILFVPGNHEFYGIACMPGSDQPQPIENINAIDEVYGDIMIKSCSVYESEDAIFLCATLWTDFALYGQPAVMSAKRVAPEFINDYEYNPYLRPNPEALHGSPEIMWDWHMKQRDWLECQLSRYRNTTKILVVVTHHCPTEEVLDPHFREARGSMRLANASFASNLEYLMDEYPIRWWLCGHTHKARTCKVFNTWIALNPRGNMGSYETLGFRPNVVIDLKEQPYAGN